MFALIDINKYGKCAILDTDDGVVDYISKQELDSYRKMGFRFYNKTDLCFCSTLYNDIVKFSVLGKDFDTKFYKEIYSYLLKLSTYIKRFSVPSNLYNFDIKIESSNDCYIVIFKHFNNNEKRDYLYSITSNGIFCFNQDMFKSSYSLNLVPDNNEIIIEVTSEKAIMTYGIFIVDKTMQVSDQSRYQPTKEEKKGYKL